MTSQYNSRCCEEERRTPFSERQVRKNDSKYRTVQNKEKSQANTESIKLSLAERNLKAQGGKSKWILFIKFRVLMVQKYNGNITVNLSVLFKMV